VATDYLEEKEFKSIQNDAVELLKIITSILKTSKANLYGVCAVFLMFNH